LRLRIKKSLTESKSSIDKDRLDIFQNNAKTAIEDEKLKLGETSSSEEIDNSSYFYMLSVLFVIVVILLMVRKLLQSNNKNSSTWLFNKIAKVTGNTDLNIISSKPLDIQNRIMEFEFKNKNYVVLLSANGSLLLDKKTTEEYKKAEFNDLLNKSEDNLNQFINDK